MFELKEERRSKACEFSGNDCCQYSGLQAIIARKIQKDSMKIIIAIMLLCLIGCSSTKDQKDQTAQANVHQDQVSKDSLKFDLQSRLDMVIAAIFENQSQLDHLQSMQQHHTFYDRQDTTYTGEIEMLKMEILSLQSQKTNLEIQLLNANM